MNKSPHSPQIQPVRGGVLGLKHTWLLGQRAEHLLSCDNLQAGRSICSVKALNFSEAPRNDASSYSKLYSRTFFFFFFFLVYRKIKVIRGYSKEVNKLSQIKCFGAGVIFDAFSSNSSSRTLTWNGGALAVTRLLTALQSCQ